MLPGLWDMHVHLMINGQVVDEAHRRRLPVVAHSPRPEAIRAATYWPSVMMRVDDRVGTVSEGKYADIIAVRGDVLRHINLLHDVDRVIKRGTRDR